MLKIQSALHDGMIPSDIAEKYGIIVRPHPRHPNLLLFKYSQIKSPMGEELVRECRGLILDSTDNWRVISRSFDRFFNAGEMYAAKINWSTACVQNKLDGSICTLYWYDGQWHVSTSGSPDAGGNVNGNSNLTFEKLFWQTFRTQGLKLPSHRHIDYNYIFELMSPHNRIVVQHTNDTIKLIGIRNRFSGQELSVYSDHAAATGYPVVEAFSLNSFETIVATFATMDPLKQEGYVVVDGDFNRIKEKNPKYVALHHLRGEDSLSSKRILTLIQSGEWSEVLTYWPEWTEPFNVVRDRLNKFKYDLEQAYLQIEDYPSQKEFALEAVKNPCSGALFAMRAKKVKNIDEYITQMNTNALMELLNLKDPSNEI